MWRHETSEMAEMAVLGHLLAMSSPLAAIMDVDLSNDDFMLPVHGAMFGAMVDQLRESQRVDPVRLIKTIGDQLELKGGRDYLKTLRKYSYGSLKAREAAEAVKDTSRRRTLEQACRQAADMAADYGQAIDDAQAMLHQAMATTMRSGDRRPEQVGQMVQDHLQSLMDLQQRGGVSGLSSPFPDLDRFTGGFGPGEVVILAGRPGTGKTALALNIAFHVARLGNPVGVFSLEMPARQLLNRIYAAYAGVNAQHFRNGRFSQDEWDRMYRLSDELSNMPFLISDRSAIKPMQLREKCRIWQQEHGLGMVIIDYLQLISPESRGQSREREVADISRTIKTTAVDLGVPVLLLAQLNREAEKADRPMLSHLRESGAVEQDADMVLFLRPWDVATDAQFPIVELDIAKGRSNSCGSLKLLYDKQHLLFNSYHEEMD